jgi:hypothetical protein
MDSGNQVNDAIREVVTEWVAKEKMFTAFEISLEVKKKGIQKRHREMRETVHEIILEVAQPKNYARQLTDVGAPELAWLYYPASANPATYTPLERVGGTSWPAPPANPVPPSQPPLLLTLRDPEGIPKGASGVDARGRLCLPVRMLQAIGVKGGDRVSVSVKGEELHVHNCVSATTPPGDPVEIADGITIYTAEPDGNVRLTQKTLAKANIAGLQCYRISQTADSIVVCNFNG